MSGVKKLLPGLLLRQQNLGKLSANQREVGHISAHFLCESWLAWAVSQSQSRFESESTCLLSGLVLCDSARLPVQLSKYV